MKYREYAQELEEKTLSEFAAKSKNSKGREREEEQCDVRTAFMRDRDRIVHSKAFRRLKFKTQVFLAPEGDHYRTRLTHTLEVSQIARTIARALRLNEDLTEAISLGHDLGHAPFGHSGESVLDNITSCGFHHAKHSVRMVEKLEKDRKGLNLTLEVRDGILNHSGDNMAFTLEGQIVRIADRIAYINHDIDDAVRAKVLSVESIPKEYTDVLGDSHAKRINKLILSMIEASSDYKYIRLMPDINEALLGLRSFMFENVYLSKEAKKEEDKAKTAIEMLYNFYKERPHKLPHEYAMHIDDEGLERTLIDYIAGMTDRYVISEFERIYVPKAWN